MSNPTFPSTIPGSPGDRNPQIDGDQKEQNMVDAVIHETHRGLTTYYKTRPRGLRSGPTRDKFVWEEAD